MSILIKGMEMPKTCIECMFSEHGSINEFEYWCKLTGSRLGAWGDKQMWEDMRAADCPLIEIPPHGATEQIKWERDIAIEQLKSIGKGLGEKMDDIQPVKTGNGCAFDQFATIPIPKGATYTIVKQVDLTEESINRIAEAVAEKLRNCGAKMEGAEE